MTRPFLYMQVLQINAWRQSSTMNKRVVQINLVAITGFKTNWVCLVGEYLRKAGKKLTSPRRLGVGLRGRDAGSPNRLVSVWTPESRHKKRSRCAHVPGPACDREPGHY
jgi:hypothetical protein